MTSRIPIRPVSASCRPIRCDVSRADRSVKLGISSQCVQRRKYSINRPNSAADIGHSTWPPEDSSIDRTGHKPDLFPPAFEFLQLLKANPQSFTLLLSKGQNPTQLIVPMSFVCSPNLDSRSKEHHQTKGFNFGSENIVLRFCL